MQTLLLMLIIGITIITVIHSEVIPHQIGNRQWMEILEHSTFCYFESNKIMFIEIFRLRFSCLRASFLECLAFLTPYVPLAPSHYEHSVCTTSHFLYRVLWRMARLVALLVGFKTILLEMCFPKL